MYPKYALLIDMDYLKPKISNGSISVLRDLVME